MFDKILELIAASEKIGFAMFAAALSVFVGQYYGAWPFTLLQDNLGIVLFAGLFGGFLVLLRVLGWIGKGTKACGKWCKTQWHHFTVLSRVNKLPTFEQGCVLWIINNPTAKLYGDPTDEPWRRLHIHGFVFRTEDSLFSQAFLLNKRVLNGKSQLESLFNKSQCDALGLGMVSPWEQAKQRSRWHI